MSSALLGSATDRLDAARASGSHEGSARAVLGNYAITLLVPLVGLVVLLTGWTITAAGGWPAAVAAVGIFAAGSAAWLYRRAWSPARVRLVTWAAPATLLMPPAALGWLSADGLVLWAPVTTVLALCLTLTHEPLPVTGPPDTAAFTRECARALLSRTADRRQADPAPVVRARTWSTGAGAGMVGGTGRTP